MNAFVLMNKKNGVLFEGVRVKFYDDKRFKYELGGDVKWDITLSAETNDYDGWLIFNDLMAPYRIFFNRECEKWFENLGEL